MIEQAASEPVIEVTDVVTRFGDHVVHDHVDLSVQRGEIFALAGGSGSGKTRLLHEIVTLEQPVSGSIRVFGQQVAGISEAAALPIRKRLGVLFQRGALFTSMTVCENVSVPLREHTRLGPRLITELAALKIALTGLEPDAATLYPSELSGGMAKRAALARAIALDPELLFLDEPTAGLDPTSAAGLDELVLNLKALLGLTVVMVTHDLDSMWRVADRVAVLGEGRVAGVGTMEELSRSQDPLIYDYFHGPRGRAAQEQAWALS